MKAFVAFGVVVALTSPFATPTARAQSAQEQIAQAVTPLPEDLRAGATVYTYDKTTGARTVLREGTNFVECMPRSAEDGFTRCYPKVTAARRDLQAKLEAEKKSEKEIQAAVAAAVKAGTIPASQGTMMYRLYDKDDRIKLLWVMSLPNNTTETIAVSTESQRDAAIKGNGLPWLMLPGTPGSHVMIPINPPVKASKVTDVAADPIAQALLPLPEDLRAGATVFTYDKDTGARKVLRPGTNAVECMPKNPEDGFTWCYSKVSGPRRDLQAKLRAEKKSDKEIQEAVAAATKAGTIKPTPVGTMSYRLYGKDDRIRLLWVISVPNATPESVGVSAASQRDSAIGGNGLPWLMLPGTPGAHIMVPINR